MSKSVMKDILDDLARFDDTPKGRAMGIQLDLGAIIFKRLAEDPKLEKRAIKKLGCTSKAFWRVANGDAVISTKTIGEFLAAIDVQAELVVKKKAR